NAWTALWQEMNRRAPVEDGSASKPQPNIAAPSPEPIPAVDPWEGLDIPPSLRRAPKEVAASVCTAAHPPPRASAPCSTPPPPGAPGLAVRPPPPQQPQPGGTTHLSRDGTPRNAKDR